MYRIIRAATAQAQQADLAAAQIEMATMRGELEALRATADRAVATAIRAEDTSEAAWRQLAAAASDAGRADGELSFLRAQHLLDTEDRAVLRMLLRITRKQTRVTDRVYVLFQRGELHSIHSTTESAESAAEAEGAPPGRMDLEQARRAPSSRLRGDVAHPVAPRGRRTVRHVS
ncbi:hypothetical protein OG795_32960 (plasmid) [[Kitasatospora] papulosa]|uniref:hypothetical protein n=1 Tax=[Kitasatospora] papulosa TaxID=1464011 RepID=UPI002F912705